MQIADVERGLIGSLLVSPNRFAAAARMGVVPEWFDDEKLGAVYGAMQRLYARGGGADLINPILVLEEVAAAGGNGAAKVSADELGRLIDVGGGPATVEVFAGYVRDAYCERELRKAASEFSKVSGNPDEILARIRRRLDKIEAEARPRTSTPDEIAWRDVPPPPPEEENPLTIFCNGYLRKGHSLFIVSTSGAGKSVLSNQMVAFAAAGREFLGMRPNRKLKIGVVQSEDDAEEMFTFRENLRKGCLDDFEWTESEFDDALSRVVFASKCCGKVGENFVEWLRGWQKENRFDIVLLNPLFAFFGGDLSSGRDVTHFFRELLDPLMKDPDYGFCLIVVNHTVKPPKGDERKTWGQDAFGQYLGAGGTDIAGWSRASFLLLPISGHYGWFRFVATKRGGRLGWRDADGNIATERILRYGEKSIYWRIPEPDEIPADVLKAAAMAAKPAEIGEADARAKILAHLRVKPETTTALWKWSCTQFQGLNSAKEVPAKRAYTDVVNHPERYGVSVRKKGKANELYIDSTLPGMEPPPGSVDDAEPGGAVVGDYDDTDMIGPT